MVNSFYHRFRLNLSRLSPLGRCILCDAQGQPGLDLCAACLADLPTLGPCCFSCALPVQHISGYCGQCLQTKPAFTRTVASWVYHPPIAQLISGFKYKKQLCYGENLAKINLLSIVSAYKEGEDPDLITATPLHWRRHLQRGFNQSEFLAQHYARQLNTPLKTLIKRRKSTPPQQTLDAKQRKRNLKNAFSICANVEGKTIALVDDVMTTGATANEISRCLLTAGAREVHLWCLARTPD